MMTALGILTLLWLVALVLSRPVMARLVAATNALEGDHPLFVPRRSVVWTAAGLVLVVHLLRAVVWLLPVAIGLVLAWLALPELSAMALGGTLAAWLLREKYDA